MEIFCFRKRRIFSLDKSFLRMTVYEYFTITQIMIMAFLTFLSINYVTYTYVRPQSVKVTLADGRG